MNRVFSILCFIFVLSFGSNESKCRKNTVAFQNNLFQSHSILKVHCKSRDDDLGDHFVKFQDPAYNFSFHDNPFLTTKFNCNLSKGARMEYQRKFLAYEGAPIYRCGTLYAWDARDDAIYLSKNGKEEKLMYSWVKD